MNVDVREHGRKKFLFLVILMALLTATTAAPLSAYAVTEEQRLVEYSKNLKPINNSQWNEIAGSKVSDTYDIVKGDTLWDISKRLFGNSFYWPKIWSFNAGIGNPHVVEPGQKLAFTSGSSESTPKLAPDSGGTTAATAAPVTVVPAARTADNSGKREYEKISPKLWAKEVVGVPDAKVYDEFGLDRTLKIEIPSRFVYRVPEIANDTTVPYLGEIVSTRREGIGISQHDAVFLKSNSQDLQVGSSYTVFDNPEFVREKKSDRSGYIYRSVGEIKVVGVKDDLYVAIVTTAYDVLNRGMKVYPLLPLVSDVKTLPARTALEALVVMGTDISTRNSAQYRIIHLDRGIEDGVQIGNVFRVYDYYDPVSRKKITDSDFLVNADAIVIHATAQFSTAMVLRSHDTFTRGDFAVLLTDVSDLEKVLKGGARDFGEDDKRPPEDKELDELDELDKASGEGLGKKEEAEIKELDQWDKTKDLQNPATTEPTVPSAADTPTDDAEKLPGSEIEPGHKAPPQDPTLDQTLDAPSVTPPGLETPAPPAHLKPAPEQTLEAPPPPKAQEEPSMPGEPSPGPNVEPIVPPDSNTVEPGLPSQPDDVKSN